MPSVSARRAYSLSVQPLSQNCQKTIFNPSPDSNLSSDGSNVTGDTKRAAIFPSKHERPDFDGVAQATSDSSLQCTRIV